MYSLHFRFCFHRSECILFKTNYIHLCTKAIITILSTEEFILLNTSTFYFTFKLYIYYTTINMYYFYLYKVDRFTCVYIIFKKKFSTNYNLYMLL